MSDKSEIVVRIDGKEACRLKAGDFFRFSTKPQRESIEICASIGSEQLCRTIEPKLFYTEVYLIRSKHGKPDIDHLNEGGALKTIMEDMKNNPKGLKCNENY